MDHQGYFDCRLSGNWRAKTMEWEDGVSLPNINEQYDMNVKLLIVVLEQLFHHSRW